MHARQISVCVLIRGSQCLVRSNSSLSPHAGSPGWAMTAGNAALASVVAPPINSFNDCIDAFIIKTPHDHSYPREFHSQASAHAACPCRKKSRMAWKGCGSLHVKCSSLQWKSKHRRPAPPLRHSVLRFQPSSLVALSWTSRQAERLLYTRLA